MVVACNISKDGTELLVKSYKGIYYWKRAADTSLVAMLQKPAIRLPYEEEPQGEAITWAIDGKGYYTLGEKKKNDTVHLLYYERN